MDAVIYVLLFSSSILIVIETWSVFIETKQRMALRRKLRLIESDLKAIDNMDIEQYQKISKILDTIEVCDIEPTPEVEHLLQSYKTVHERLGQRYGYK